jgi:hypothetical protein
MDETEISSERVIADLVENVEIAMGRKPSRRSVWRSGKLCQIEVFEHNGVRPTLRSEKHFRVDAIYRRTEISESAR